MRWMGLWCGLLAGCAAGDATDSAESGVGEQELITEDSGESADSADSEDSAGPVEASCAGICAYTIASGCETEEGRAECEADCVEDLATCPAEMRAVLACYAERPITCDPEEDAGIGLEGCEAEHAAAHTCGFDPF